MRFFLVDDDGAVRSVLKHIIEGEKLGTVVSEAETGCQVTSNVLSFYDIDIVIMDLLMPDSDGIETIKSWNGEFKGKVIMLSQVEAKELIGAAYTEGIDYYVTKPINKKELVAVIHKVIQTIQLEKTVNNIRRSLNGLMGTHKQDIQSNGVTQAGVKIVESAEFLLSELGIIGENGSKDLLEMVQYLYEHEINDGFDLHFPSLKELFEKLSIMRLGETASSLELNRETKASEQRVRRAINQSITHWANIGLSESTNGKFENYATKFFDFSTIRCKMTELRNEEFISPKQVKIHTKKFIQVLYFEAKKLASSEMYK
ncbi:response regulator [Niallia taxi]|uniref:Response regulator n=1 Tax=Niallia taxi TaxID=2499688 RepID=A0A437K5D9_9BACI|nr:response regulator [Niallia taxi]MDK8641219.1 response regulator [Niallia taxi]MED4038724.1 response regulator [Niallia taxi]RVT57978.1 response regulator [Niallia taxi]